jgi:hypothetical protein
MWTEAIAVFFKLQLEPWTDNLMNGLLQHTIDNGQ